MGSAAAGALVLRGCWTGAQGSLRALPLLPGIWAYGTDIPAPLPPPLPALALSYPEPCACCPATAAAVQVGAKLVVLNLSQQTDSGDLLGGFRPVQPAEAVLPLLDRFADLVRGAGEGQHAGAAGRWFGTGACLSRLQELQQPPSLFSCPSHTHTLTSQPPLLTPHFALPLPPPTPPAGAPHLVARQQ